MRYLLVHRLDESKPGAWDPSPDVYVKMGELIEDMTKSGTLLAAEGVLPSSHGARLRYEGGKRTVTDGPFTEAKETILSFALVEVRSKEEAIELSKRFWQIAGSGEGQIRQVYGPE